VKFCNFCKIEHPITSEFWYRLERSPRCKIWLKIKSKNRNVTKKIEIAKYQKEYRELNKDKRREDNARWREENKESHRASSMRWYHNNKERAISKSAEYTRNRRNTDIEFKLICNIRTRTSAVLRGRIKSGSSVTDLGCTPEYLKLYLESKFESGMSWENYGSVWEIDHIIPLSSFDLSDRTQFLKAVNYENLAPLLVFANRSKGAKVPQAE